MSEKHVITTKKGLKILLFCIGILAGIFIVFKLSLYLAPFIIAFAIASLIEPVILFLIKKAKLKRKVAAPLTLLLVLSVSGSILVLLISRLIYELVSITNMLPEYYSRIYKNIRMLIDKGTELYLGLPHEIAKNIEGIISDLSDSLVKILNSFLKGVLNTAISIPEALIFILVTILATYFFTSDRDRMRVFFKSQLPESWFNKARSIRNDLFSALFGYIRAQLILMIITFTELFIGFTVIDINHALLLATIISFIDALPILGTGGILIPWSIYDFLTGNTPMGVSILVLYGIILAVRQFTEPKILSHQIGLHPLVTLISMYSGLRLFGFPGLILGPVTVLLLKNVLSGILKDKPIKDFFSNPHTNDR